MIPFNPVARGWEEDGPAIQAAIDRIGKRGQWILGPEVEAFEHEWAEWVGARYCVAVASGTDALKIALRACGIRPPNRDRDGYTPLVITVANTCPATASAIHECGGRVELCDVEGKIGGPCRGWEGFPEGGFRPNPRPLSDSKIRAAVPVAIYGRVRSENKVPFSIGMHEEVKLIDKLRCVNAPMSTRPRIALVHDLCQAHDRGVWEHVAVRERDRMELAAWSFYPTKPLGALGDAGMIGTDGEDLARECRRLRQYGYGEHQEVIERQGWNSRMDDMQAAILRERLKRLPERDRKRAELAEVYRLAAATGTWSDRLLCGTHIVAALFEDRDAAERRLAEEYIQTRVHYRTPIHRMPEFAYTGSFDLSGAETWCRSVLSLPYGNWTTLDEAKAAAEAVTRIMQEQVEKKN